MVPRARHPRQSESKSQRGIKTINKEDLHIVQAVLREAQPGNVQAVGRARQSGCKAAMDRVTTGPSLLLSRISV